MAGVDPLKLMRDASASLRAMAYYREHAELLEQLLDEAIAKPLLDDPAEEFGALVAAAESYREPEKVFTLFALALGRLRREARS